VLLHHFNLFLTAFALSHESFIEFLKTKNKYKNQAVSEEQQFEEALTYLPNCYKEANWEAAIQFRVVLGVEGASLFKTLLVTPNNNTKAQVFDYFENVTRVPILCVINLDRSDFIKIIEGTTNPVKSYLEKRISVDSLDGFIKFTQAFEFTKERHNIFVNKFRETNSIEEAQRALPKTSNKGAMQVLSGFWKRSYNNSILWLEQLKQYSNNIEFTTQTKTEPSKVESSRWDELMQLATNSNGEEAQGKLMDTIQAFLPFIGIEEEQQTQNSSLLSASNVKNLSFPDFNTPQEELHDLYEKK